VALMNPAIVLMDVDPSIVKPGWTALLVTVFIGAALLLLYFSLRRQVRKIDPDLPYSDEVDGGVAESAGGADPAPPAVPDITGKKSGASKKS
jgi:hypothetical protein